MVETDAWPLRLGAISKFMGAEVELHGEFLQLKKKRMIKVQKSLDMYVSWSLDLNVSFRLNSDHREASNGAEVFLLPEELPVFTQALIGHPILFPISYSQYLSMERGMYCIRLRSQEPPEDFAERLSEALAVLE